MGNNNFIETYVCLPFVFVFLWESVGVGDESIRKIAYFDSAKDPSIFKEM